MGTRQTSFTWYAQKIRASWVQKAFKEFLKNIFNVTYWYVHYTTSPHSHHVNYGTSYRWTSFCIPSLKKVTSKPSASPARLWSLGHASDSDSSKISWGGNTHNNHVLQGWDCMQHGHKFPAWIVCAPNSFLITHKSCFLWTTNTISSDSLCSFHLCHTLQQSAYKFPPYKHFWHSKIVSLTALWRCQDFQFSYSALMTTANSRKNYDALLCKKHVPCHNWPSQDVRTSPARPLFATGSYVLDTPRTYRHAGSFCKGSSLQTFM